MRCERIALPAELYPRLRNSIIPLNNSYYISFFGFVKMHDTGKSKLRRKSRADARKDVITGKDIADMIRYFENAFAGTEWIWLTADCPVEERVDTEYRSVIADSSGRSPVEPFADYTDFAAFLHEHGFTVRRSRMTETVSPCELYAATFFSVDEAETRERMESYTDIALLTRA